MNHTQFFTVIKNKAFAPCYLLEGEEEYIKQSAVAALEKALLPQGLEALNETQLDNPSVGDLIAACETMPLMADKRLVIVRDPAWLSGKGKDEDAQRLTDYLDQMPDYVLLILLVRGKADMRRKVTMKLKSKQQIVSFAPLDEQELAKWIAQTLKPYNKTMSYQTVNYFTFSVGRDTALLKGELHKLCAHAGDREEIDKDDIDAVCSKSMECTVFELTDEIVAGHTAQALRLMNHLLKTGSDRIAILQMVLRQYRILYHLSLMTKDNLSAPEIQKALGIPPFAVDRARKQASAYTLDALKIAVNKLIKTDYMIKSGKLNPDGAIENIILELGLTAQSK